MSSIWRSVLVGGAALAAAAAAFAANDTPTKFVTVDQNIDQATLHRYHFTDQGTRLIPAAWLDALVEEDGEKIMDPDGAAPTGISVRQRQGRRRGILMAGQSASPSAIPRRPAESRSQG